MLDRLLPRITNRSTRVESQSSFDTLPFFPCKSPILSSPGSLRLFPFSTSPYSVPATAARTQIAQYSHRPEHAVGTISTPNLFSNQARSMICSSVSIDCLSNPIVQAHQILEEEANLMQFGPSLMLSWYNIPLPSRIVLSAPLILRPRRTFKCAEGTMSYNLLIVMPAPHISRREHTREFGTAQMPQGSHRGRMSCRPRKISYTAFATSAASPDREAHCRRLPN